MAEQHILRSTEHRIQNLRAFGINTFLMFSLKKKFQYLIYAMKKSYWERRQTAQIVDPYTYYFDRNESF